MKIANRPLLAALLGCASLAPAGQVFAEEQAAPYPHKADGDGTVRGSYATTRWAEDWSGVQDRKDEGDPLDRLKYLPLDDDGDVYVTLPGELRLRTNYTSNPGLMKGEHQRQDIIRVVGAADVHLGSHVRLYGEFAHASSSGHNIGTPTTSQDNDLVVQQAFAEVSGIIGGLDMGLRYGRQEFFDGSRMLVSQRDNNAIPYTLNGIRGWVRGRGVRLDAFDLEPTAYGRGGAGDDRPDKARRFSGVTLGTVVPETLTGASGLYVDPFFWRLRRRDARWVGSEGREERYYLGAHAWGRLGDVAIDWTVNRQFGDYDGRDIDAWQVFLDQTMSVGSGKASPRVGFSFDYASGGGGNESGAGAGALRNAISPHGANTPFSHHLFLTATNLVEVAPVVSLEPIFNVRVLAEYAFAWRADTSDAIYRANGAPLARTVDSTASKTAELPRVQVQWAISPRVSITARYEHVFAGLALRQAGYGDSDFLATWLSMRF